MLTFLQAVPGLLHPTVYPFIVLIHLKKQHADNQSPNLPLWVRRVILIQSHAARPSVWPWNPGICPLLLLGFVRWQAKTVMGDLGQLSCTVVRVWINTQAQTCLWVSSRGQTLAQATVFVMVAYGTGIIGQKTYWERLCHSNISFLGSVFTESLTTLTKSLRGQFFVTFSSADGHPGAVYMDPI